MLGLGFKDLGLGSGFVRVWICLGLGFNVRA